jgi:putative Mg2+ transporter-C (MgtC) family protein
VEERGETTVDVIATLTATTVHSKDLDAVVADLAKRPEVRHATWTVQTGD